MCAAFAARRMQVCQGCMPMKIPTEVQRRTCAAENAFVQQSQFSETHRCNLYIVKLYVLHYVV